MNIKRRATAVWHGSGKDGHGHLTTQSTILSKTQYSFNTRFNEGIGTNPEELIAAAHAGCFTMKLSFVLNEAGFTADKLTTEATVTLENGEISKSHLVLQASISGISQEKFEACVREAELNCPVSKVLNATITVDAKLEVMA